MSSVSRSCSRSAKNEPFLPTIQEETELSFIVVVPADAVPGTVLSRKAPDGKDLDLTVPDGILPGTTLVLTQDAETRAWRCAVEVPTRKSTSKAAHSAECEAERPPAAAAAKSSVSVVVPDGATAGTKLVQKMPDGKELDLIVPDGVPAGSVLNLTQDPATGKWTCTVELKKPPSPTAAAACKACESSEAASDTSVSVVVPEGAEPGSTLQAETRSGKIFDLTIPDGVSAGWLLSLTQDSSTGKWVCSAEPPQAAERSAREEQEEEEEDTPEQEEPATRPPARLAAAAPPESVAKELVAPPAAEREEEPVVVPVKEQQEMDDEGRHEEEQRQRNDDDDEDEEEEEETDDDDDEEDEDEEEDEEEEDEPPEVVFAPQSPRPSIPSSREVQLQAASSPSRHLRLQAAQQAWAARTVAVEELPPSSSLAQREEPAAAAEDAVAADRPTDAEEAEQQPEQLQPLHRATSSEDRGFSVAPPAGHPEEDRLSETALLPTMPLPPPPPQSAAPARPLVVPTSIPPRYCSAHGTSAQRLKSVPKLWECTGCQMQVQTNYNDFTLCGPCSERQARCMICGGDAPTAGKYVPPCALATAASAPPQAVTASLGGAEQLQDNDEEAVQNVWGSKDVNNVGKAFDAEHKESQQRPPFRLSSSAPYYPQQQPLHPSQAASLGASWPSITSRPFPQETVPAVLPPHEAAQAGGIKVLGGMATFGWPPLGKIQVDPLLGPPQPMGAALATNGFAAQRPGGGGGVGALRPMTYPTVAPGAFGPVHPPVLFNNSHGGAAMHTAPFLMGGQFPPHQPVSVAVDDLSRSQRFPMPMA